MKLTLVQRLMLVALSEFYSHLNQPLIEKPVKLQTSKSTFIEHLIHLKELSKTERAIYKNLETLENKKLISYDKRMIKFTELGIKECEKLRKEIAAYEQIRRHFQSEDKVASELQTTLKVNK